MAVRYDDRLMTVLAQPAAQAHDRAVRWRQLVELLGRGQPGDRALADRAIEAVRSDAPLVDEQVRMAAARAIAALPIPVALVAAFAADSLSVAAPVLAAARLTASEWAEVIAVATPDCRRFVTALRGEAPAPPPPHPAAESEAGIPSISEVVARIERLRHAREKPGEAELPLPDTAEPPRLFRWECGESGEISWADGVPRGAVIGRSVVQRGAAGETDARVKRALALRIPFREAALELAEGSVAAGRWTISGSPVFDPSSGRFAGYRGIAERGRSLGAPPMFAMRDPNSLRELAHEIKTPLNAIIGFAEIISGQYLGPAEPAYRDRAKEIVEQAQLLLAAIDDLDFAARLHAGRGPTAPAGLAQAIERAGGHRHHEYSPAGDESLSERLVSRFCRTVIAMSDEHPTFSLEEDDSHCIVSVRHPAPSAGEPSLGLQLVLGLARIAGGDLRTASDRLELVLPKA